MTIRAVMTEELTTPDVESESMLGTNDLSSIEPSEDNSELQNGGSLNTIRSRGSKVSNLRAAFENAVNNDAARPQSIEKRVGSNGRPPGLEAELSRLKDALTKEQEQNDANKQRMEAMQAELEELRERLLVQQHAQKDEMEQSEGPTEEQRYANGHIDSEALINELYIARARAQEHEEESAQLRNQLAELKRSIATNTRIESHEITDSAFQGEFGTLCYLIQDWVINSHRKTKIEKTAEELSAAVATLANEQHRDLLKALFVHWNSNAKLAFLQSAVASLMLPIFQESMPFGLPSNLTWSDAVRLASKELQDILDPTAYNRWRATTFDIICHSEAMSPFVHSAANDITETICTTIDHICGATTSEAQIDALRNVVRRTIVLSHGLRIQRASYELQLPAPGSAFDPAKMEGISEDHDDNLPDRTVRCAVFPAVFKIASMGNRALIFKARVSWKESCE